MEKIKRMLVQSTFRRFFLTYLALFLALTTVAAVIVLGVMQYERGKKARLACEENAEKLSLSVSTELGSVHKITGTLRSAVWTSKLMSDGGMFDGEFDILRQKEISSELISLAAGNRAVKEIAVLYPQRSLAVAPSGWWEMDEYMRRLARIYSAAEDGLQAAVLSADGPEGGILFSQNFCYQNPQILLFAQPLGSLGAPRALALVVLDKGRLEEACSRYFSDELAFFELTDAKLGPLLSVERPGEGNGALSLEKPCASLLAQITVRYRIPRFQIGGGDMAVFLFLELFLCLAAVGISYWAASRNYRPMGRLLSRLHLSLDGGRKNEYETIESSFETLHAANRDMQRQAELYHETARQAVLMRLLKGCFDARSAVEELQKYHIPYTDDSCYAVVLLSPEEQPPVGPGAPSENGCRVRLLAACAQALRELGVGGVPADTMDGWIAVILHWKDGQKEAAFPGEYAARLTERVERLSGLSVEAAVSGLHKGIIGVSVAYQEAAAPRLPSAGGRGAGPCPARRTGRMYYYPTDWEMQFIEALKSGNGGIALSILDQLAKENQARELPGEVQERLLALLEETVRRVAFEAGIRVEPGSGGPDFSGVARMAEQACRAVSDQEERMLQDVKGGILEYVNRNYRHSDLTLKSLSARYDISAPSVSRIFKEVTGTNFYEYLTALRMQKAKELLQICGCDAKKVYAQVGYDSDYSFKRAFLRVVGVKPGEYKER